jgi:hypothetical protein
MQLSLRRMQAAVRTANVSYGMVTLVVIDRCNDPAVPQMMTGILFACDCVEPPPQDRVSRRDRAARPSKP